MLLGSVAADLPDVETLTIQLTAALEAPILLYLAASDAELSRETESTLGNAWQDLIQRVVRS